MLYFENFEKTPNFGRTVRPLDLFSRVCLVKFWFWLTQILRNNFCFNEKIASLKMRPPWKFYFLTIFGGEMSVCFKWCHIYMYIFWEEEETENSNLPTKFFIYSIGLVLFRFTYLGNLNPVFLISRCSS